MRASTKHAEPNQDAGGVPFPAPESLPIPEPDADAPLVLVASEPARRVVLPVASIDADRLGIGELLDMADALETDLDGIAALMRSGGGIARARIVVAFAWILVRRLEPDATWADAQRWRIEVQGIPIESKAGTPRPKSARRGSAP